MGKIHLPGGKKGERLLKRMLKPVKRGEIASELGVSEAWVQQIERRLDKLENAAKGEDSRDDKIWKWVQEQWRKEGWDATEDNIGDKPK